MTGLCLVLGICTRYAALGAAAVLGIAVYALQVVKGFSGWTWTKGGHEHPALCGNGVSGWTCNKGCSEYPVFWAIVCIGIAIEEWKAVFAARRAKGVAPAGKLA